jgi:hypothetical protein
MEKEFAALIANNT